MTKATKITPLMKQYNDIKLKYPNTMLLFRVGDFYETFGEDAVVASKVLGIVLTKRGAGSTSETELAGFPHHSIENYLPKLVKAGHRVAICDQLEDPKLTKKIVKRGVTEIVTPGIAMNDGVLEIMFSGVLKKMVSIHDNPVRYIMDFDDDLVFLNQIIGKKIKIHKTGYCCLSCYENLQIFANGFCKKCFFESPMAGDWVMKPELSKAHLEIEDRDISYEKKVQLQNHIVYLSDGSYNVSRYCNY